MNLKQKLFLALIAISTCLYLLKARLLGVYNPIEIITISGIEPKENTKTILFWNLYWIWEDFDMNLGNEGNTLRLFSSLTPCTFLQLKHRIPKLPRVQ